MIPASGRCANHPARAGIALCVVCRKTICAECSTQFDGINRCADCLAGMRRKDAAAARPHREWGAGNLLLAFACLALSTLAALSLSYCGSPS